MKVHALRNVITQVANDAPVIIRTAGSGGSILPRELISAEYGYQPEAHLTLIVAPETLEKVSPPSDVATIVGLRKITSHKVNPLNDVIELEVLDEPGSGGACHVYRAQVGTQPATIISFQNGPIAEKGPNGLTQEVLLAIVIDRLESFQAGPFACNANQLALELIHAGLDVLKKRTLDRMAQKVEGTHQPHVEEPRATEPTSSAPVAPAPAPDQSAAMGGQEEPAPLVAEAPSPVESPAAAVTEPVTAPDGTSPVAEAVASEAPDAPAPDLTRPPGE